MRRRGGVPEGVVIGVLRLAVIASVAVSLLVVFQHNESADASFSGDFNCDTSVNTDDVIAVLGVAGGVSPLSSCANSVSVDCDGDTDITDAIMLLNYLAGFDAGLPDECSDINALIPGTSPSDAADELYARITGDGSLLDVVSAVEETLARGGVSTGDADGTIYTQAVEPAALSVAIPLEVQILAVAARTGSHQMDAVELGDMLADFGWPFLDDSTPGEQIVAMLQELVVGAQDLPDDPNSFTPLFLQHMAQAQDPAVDLAAGDAAPESVHLNLLGLRLLFAVFERQTVYPSEPLSGLAVPAANEPCSDAKKVLSGVYGPFGGQINGLLIDAAGPIMVEKAMEKAGASKGTIGKVGSALGAITIASKILKLLDFYASQHVDVQIIDGSNRLHKPLNGPNLPDPDEVRTFNATAGISEADWKAYEAANANVGSEINNSVRDCLNQFGLDVFSDLGDIIKDAANWKIDWTIANNRDNHRGEKAITWDPDEQESGRVHLGLWRSDTIKTSEFSYEAAFRVDIGDEIEPDHAGIPTVKIADVYVCGNVVSAQPPELQTFVDAMTGILGLIGAIVDLGAGWIREVAPPQSCRTLTVLWHEPCPLGAQQLGGTQIASATGSLAAPCAFEGTMTSTYTEHYTGGDKTITSTGTGLRFERDPVPFPDRIHYHAVAGEVAWELTGTFESPDGNCTYSGSGIYDVRHNNTSLDPLARDAYIKVWDDGGEFPRYEGMGRDTLGGGTWLLECPGGTIEQPAGAPIWFYVPGLFSVGGEIFRLADDGSMTGTYTDDHFNSGEGYSTTWTWDLDAGECEQSPVPVCQ